MALLGRHKHAFPQQVTALSQFLARHASKTQRKAANAFGLDHNLRYRCGMAEIRFERATQSDLPRIVELLADDSLGSSREVVTSTLDTRYIEAFAAIDRDANQLLAVAREDKRVVGCMQLTFIPGLSRSGMWRGQVESVRVAASHRGTGLGRQFFEWAFEQCLQRKCGLVQLTTDKVRVDALRFYESLGFVASHEGMKRSID